MRCKHEIESPDGCPKCALCDPGTNCIACEPEFSLSDCDLFEDADLEEVALIGEDARDYFANDPETLEGLTPGDRVFLRVHHGKKWATFTIVPEGENPANFPAEEDDYGGVVEWQKDGRGH